jgi:hypothetical protein
MRAASRPYAVAVASPIINESYACRFAGGAEQLQSSAAAHRKRAAAATRTIALGSIALGSYHGAALGTRVLRELHLLALVGRCVVCALPAAAAIASQAVFYGAQRNCELEWRFGVWPSARDFVTVDE